MAFDKLSELDVDYDNKSFGNLIDPYEWNTNFKKIEEVNNQNSEKVNAGFDELNSVAGASQIGSEPIEALGQTQQSTVAEQLNLIAREFDKSYTKEAIDSKLNGFIKNVAFDKSTGQFTFTWYNDTTQVIDTDLEKIPASLGFVKVEDKTFLRITNEDGSYSQTDVTALINVYTFENGKTINFTTDGYNVTGEVAEDSLTFGHFIPVVREGLIALSDQLEAAVLSAQTSATSSKEYSDLANQHEANALNYSVEANANKQASSDSADESANSAKLSQSWAVGGTDSRLNEDTNNSKYFAEQSSKSVELASEKVTQASNYADTAKQYAEQARAAASGEGVMLAQVYDTDNDGIVDKSKDSELLNGKSADFYKGAFIAEYNVTTFAEIKEAVESGKACFCKVNSVDIDDSPEDEDITVTGISIILLPMAGFCDSTVTAPGYEGSMQYTQFSHTETGNTLSVELNVENNVETWSLTKPTLPLDSYIKKTDKPIVIYTNVEVITSLFVDDTTYTDYPFKADIVCENITENYFVKIQFSSEQITSKNYNGNCNSSNGIVTIYAKEVPAENIVIPSIIGFKEV